MIELRRAFAEKLRQDTLQLLFIGRRARLNDIFETANLDKVESQKGGPNTEAEIHAVLRELRSRLSSALTDDELPLSRWLCEYVSYLSAVESLFEEDRNFIFRNAGRMIPSMLMSESAGRGETFDLTQAENMMNCMYLMQMQLVSDSIQLTDAATVADRANSSLGLLLKCLQAASRMRLDRLTIEQVGAS